MWNTKNHEDGKYFWNHYYVARKKTIRHEKTKLASNNIVVCGLLTCPELCCDGHNIINIHEKFWWLMGKSQLKLYLFLFLRVYYSPFWNRPYCTLFNPPPPPPPQKKVHNHCFQFLLGISVVPRDIKDNGYAKFWGVNKVHCGRCENGELCTI